MSMPAPVIHENPGASQQAISFHYDTSNEFFRLWLDPSMTYSCAMFGEGDDLAAAQQRKIDYHIAEARASGAARLLDIGCGWGATLLRAATVYKVASCTGLTLSKNQADYIDARCAALKAGGVAISLSSWSDHEPQAPYDAIISVGAMEHFARPNQPAAKKIQGYRDFFERCYDWLPPGGRLSLQSILWDKLDRSSASEWLLREIYPESELPELSDLLIAAKGRFSPEKVLLDPLAYVRTLNEWRRTLRGSRAAAIKIVGKEVFDRFDRYLGVCAISFFNRDITLGRMTFSRAR